MGLKISGDTLLRRIRRIATHNLKSVKVIAVDDFSFRRGVRFGTILVDLEKRQSIDLLPDCESETLALGLKNHLEIEIISRDRGATYIEGASNGAPQTKQVADRWRLLKTRRKFWRKLFPATMSNCEESYFPKNKKSFLPKKKLPPKSKSEKRLKQNLSKSLWKKLMN
ncbi:MAG: ISL3 family transposase [Pyrinomonadaceae bacterium]